MLAILLAGTFPALPAQAAPANATAPCNRADFVADVTVKDGTVFSPEASFVKTWRLRNSGSCTWTQGYELVFVGGEKLSSTTVIKLNKSVKPGATIDLSVQMKAPKKVGHYFSYWMLRSTDGKRFGVGANASSSFWAEIRVGQPAQTIFSFTNKYCAAVWRNGSGGVPCAGDEDNPAGYVERINSPVLENGKSISGAALVTHTEWVENGEIRGRYGEYVKIQKGDRFQATIGCMNGAEDCDVTYQLLYRRASGGRMQVLYTWRQKYDGNIRNIDISLDELAGGSARFYLVIIANGDAQDASAAWVNPRIVR
jgi:hypothetical protein